MSKKKVSKKNLSALRSWLMIALVALVFFSMYRLNPNQSPVRELTQLEFYDAMNEGKLV